MSTEYQVVPNALTSPPSYTCRVVAKEIIDLDRLAREINIHNPTITEEMAKTVILAFKDEVLYQLVQGNTVKIASFCSFVASLPVALANATDSLPPGVVDIKAKPSAPFKTSFVNQATFSRLPYVEKAPRISEAIDTNTGYRGWARDNYPMRLNGSDLGFDQLNASLGVWFILADGTEVKQTNIALNNPSSVIITPSFEASIPAGDQPEITVRMRNKYTVNGQVRESNYTYRVRATCSVANFFAVGTGASPVEMGTYVGADNRIRLVCEIKPSGQVTLAAGDIDGDLGSPVDINSDTTSAVLTGPVADVPVNIVDYELLVTNVTLYQKYMQEIADITAP